MMDRLDELAVFVAVLEEGSLAGAARKLRRSAPVVTRVLAAFEARAGARLIERTTRRLAPPRRDGGWPTTRGGCWRPMTRPLDLGDDGPLRGELTIPAPLVFGRRHLTPVVADFLDLHPGVSVDLILYDRNLDLIEGGSTWPCGSERWRT